MERMKQIKGFEVPETCREPQMPKSRLNMQLPDKFRKKGINTLETERMSKEMM